jgi:hypothetical protein
MHEWPWTASLWSTPGFYCKAYLDPLTKHWIWSRNYFLGSLVSNISDYLPIIKLINQITGNSPASTLHLDPKYVQTTVSKYVYSSPLTPCRWSCQLPTDGKGITHQHQGLDHQNLNRRFGSWALSAEVPLCLTLTRNLVQLINLFSIGGFHLMQI